MECNVWKTFPASTRRDWENKSFYRVVFSIVYTEGLIFSILVHTERLGLFKFLKAEPEAAQFIGWEPEVCFSPKNKQSCKRRYLKIHTYYETIKNNSNFMLKLRLISATSQKKHLCFMDTAQTILAIYQETL